MQGYKIGQYIYGESVIHRLDPRTKIICGVMTLIAILLNYQWFYLLIFVLLIAVAIAVSGVKINGVLRSLTKMKYLFLITFLFQAVLLTGEPLLQLGRICVTKEGLTLGAINLLRLLILYLGSLVLLMTTSPLTLTAGLEALLAPLEKLKIPVGYLSTIINISFRFLPTFLSDAERIKKAQQSRGAQYDSANIAIKLKSYLAILIPLMASSLFKAEEVAMAMESRCYAGHPNQVRISKLKFKRKDILFLFWMAALVMVGIITQL